MQLVSKRNFIILLAAILVVGFGLMSMFLNNKKNREIRMRQEQNSAVTPMSQSDAPEDIQKDLDDTDTMSIDKDLQDIEVELNSL